MKFIFFLFISQAAWSQVLLLPDAGMDYANYKVHCSKEGYLCTSQFFLSQIQKSSTPEFNELLNQLDYSSEAFKTQFLVRFFKIMKEESISLEQAEILLKILQQLKEFSDTQKQKAFSTIENQLIELIDLVKSNQLSEPGEAYLVVFQKAVPLNFMQKIKPQLFKLYFLKVNYKFALNTDLLLVEATCEKAIVHPSIQDEKWQIDSDTSCGLTDHLSRMTTTTSEFVKQNKNAFLITGLVLVGTAIFMNNYEVKFNF